MRFFKNDIQTIYNLKALIHMVKISMMQGHPVEYFQWQILWSKVARKHPVKVKAWSLPSLFNYTRPLSSQLLSILSST